jgi:hypothetical protein
MKFVSTLFSGLLLTFSLAGAKAKPAPKSQPVVAPVLTQDEVSIRAIQGILRELPVDSLRGYFGDSVQSSLTEENIKGFREQIGWLPRFIGDSVELFMTGTQQMDSAGRMAFFREYRFANESNKRAPLMLVHLFYQDSTSTKIDGAYNKLFDGDTKNRIADAQVWNTPNGDVDVHSVSYLEFEKGILPVIRVYDDFDTTSFDSLYTVVKGAPIIREAIARGFLAKIKAAKPGAPMMDAFGIAFLRKDPARGYMQYSFSLKTEEYDPAGAAKKASAKKPAAKKPTTPPKKSTPKKK